MRQDYDGQAQVNIINRMTMKNKAKSLIKCFKRRSVIEPIFEHLKSDNRLERNLLKSKDGNHINEILAACGFNLRKLYTVFLLPTLKMAKKSDNRKIFSFISAIGYPQSGGFPKTFVLLENK